MLIAACCCLHNLRRGSQTIYTASEDYNTTLPSENLFPLTKIEGRSSLQALQIRQEFQEYIAGKVVFTGKIIW